MHRAASTVSLSQALINCRPFMCLYSVSFPCAWPRIDRRSLPQNCVAVVSVCCVCCGPSGPYLCECMFMDVCVFVRAIFYCLCPGRNQLQYVD